MRRDAEGCGGMRWGGSYSRISAPLRVCRAVLVPSARCGACIHPHRLLPPATIPSSTSAMRGDVVSWQDDRGYGFLKRDDGGPDIFVHQSHLMMDGFRTLAIGQRVEFEEMHGERRVEAVRVRVVPEAQPQPQQTRRSAVSLMPRAVARRAAFSSSSASGGKRPAANAAAADAPAPAKRAKPAASTATANKRGVDGTTSSKGGGRPRGEST
jgi:CspA family cold shock protein